MIVPTSAQSRLSRRLRYAELLAAAVMFQRMTASAALQHLPAARGRRRGGARRAGGVGSHIYWATFSTGTLMEANLDGTGVQPLLSDQFSPEGWRQLRSEQRVGGGRFAVLTRTASRRRSGRARQALKRPWAAQVPCAAAWVQLMVDGSVLVMLDGFLGLLCSPAGELAGFWIGETGFQQRGAGRVAADRLSVQPGGHDSSRSVNGH